MRTIAVFLLAASVGLAAEASFNSQDLRLTSFSADGWVTRKLAAASATGALSSPTIEQARVEFFANQPAGPRVAVLDVPRAQYLKAEEIVWGDGRLDFMTDKGTASGRGFRCQLVAGILDLRSEVKAATPVFELTGDQGTIAFDPQRSDKDDVIRRLEVTGNVVVTRVATAKAAFDRAESSHVRYSADENKLYLKVPARVWHKGQQAVLESKTGFHEITLADRSPPAP